MPKVLLGLSFLLSVASCDLKSMVSTLLASNLEPVVLDITVELGYIQ